MKQELLEIVSSLEFDEIENVLNERELTKHQMRLFPQEEAKRRCEIAVNGGKR